MTLSLDAARDLCARAAVAAGADPEIARSLAAASVRAEAEGQSSVGLSHFVDYLQALRAGRIDGTARPVVSRPAPAFIHVDAAGGAAHPGFDGAFEEIASTARRLGLCVFLQRNAYTCGALGYFVARLAESGLVALAATNGPALLAGSGAKRPVYCTNPMAFAAPVAGAPPLLIDQSSSATAFVNIRAAAATGAPIPEGWALDADGLPTTDAKAALKGALLAFGGARGGNIALMVEVLSAGLAGSNWSLDAPSFTSGSQSPGSGLFVLALDSATLDPDFATRLAAQLTRLSHGHGVHIPGVAKAGLHAVAERDGLRIPADLHREIAAWTDSE